jgi:transposase-like protein
MNTPARPGHYKHHRFPIEIISHGVWLYCRFCLSYRDMEELLFARGIMVTYEAIRPRKRRGRLGDATGARLAWWRLITA